MNLGVVARAIDVMRSSGVDKVGLMTYQDVAMSAAGSCQPVLYPGLHWRERFGAAAHLIHWSYLSYRGNP